MNKKKAYTFCWIFVCTWEPAQEVKVTRAESFKILWTVKNKFVKRWQDKGVCTRGSKWGRSNWEGKGEFNNVCVCEFLSPNLPIFDEKVVFPPPGTGVVFSAGEFMTCFRKEGGVGQKVRWPSPFCCFLKLLQLEILNVPDFEDACPEPCHKSDLNGAFRPKCTFGSFSEFDMICIRLTLGTVVVWDAENPQLLSQHHCLSWEKLQELFKISSWVRELWTGRQENRGYQSSASTDGENIKSDFSGAQCPPVGNKACEEQMKYNVGKHLRTMNRCRTVKWYLLETVGHFHRTENWGCIDRYYLGLPRWLSGNESTCQCKRPRFSPWVGKIPWRRKWQPIIVFLPGKSYGQKSLVDYSPWGRKESDTTEWLSTRTYIIWPTWTEDGVLS